MTTGGFVKKISLENYNLFVRNLIILMGMSFFPGIQSYAKGPVKINLGSQDSTELQKNLSTNIDLLSHKLRVFYYEEEGAIHWNNQYNAAPAGSWEEKHAKELRTENIRRALDIISDSSVFYDLYVDGIEHFADELDRKYQAAPSGSAMEGFYNQSRKIVYIEFNQALTLDIRNNYHDWRDLQLKAKELDRKYQQAPSGSEKERAYNQARQQAWSLLPEKVQRETYRLHNFRQIENLAVYFESEYQRATSGSIEERTDSQLRQSLFSSAIEQFRTEAYSYPYDALYQLQGEYEQRYQSSPSGSSLEKYCAQIRDIARTSISH